MPLEDGGQHATRWTRYGLRGNPFFIEALEPDDEALYPMTLFHGRAEELARLFGVIEDGDRSASLAFAAGGHGKTTLANKVVHDLARRGYLVPPEEIQLAVEAPAMRFFRDLVAGMLQAAADADVPLPEPRSTPRKDRKVDFPALLEASTLVQTTRRPGGWHVGAALFGVGFQGAEHHAYLSPSFEPAASRHLVRRMVQELVAFGFKGVVVRVNNLDMVHKRDPAALAAFFAETRDLLQTPGVHYLMMGDEGVLALIEGDPRVRGCFNLPLPLRPFDADQVKAVLGARYRQLAIGKEWVPPADERLVEALHKLHYGDLRNILADLGRVAQGVKPVHPEPITMGQAMPVLMAVYDRMLANTLGEELWETLLSMERIGRPCRQVDLRPTLGITPAGVHQRFQRLEEAGAIELGHRDGVSKFYRVTSAGRLALLSRLLQKRLGDEADEAEEAVIRAILKTLGLKMPD